MDSLVEEPFCRNEQVLTQKKTTRLFSDTLGPFPDEPLLYAVDKTLFFTCDLYTTLYAPDAAALYASGFLEDAGSISKCSSKISIAQLSKNKELSNLLLNKSFSTSNLSQLSKLSSLSNLSKLSKLSQSSKSPDCSSKPKCKKKVKPCQVCGGATNRPWVKTKTTPQGVKSYEIWSNDVCQKCPSIVFILTPGGDAVSFESVPNK